MRMDDQDESRNVEDVRGESGGGGFGFRPVHGIGLGTIGIALVGGWLLGINPLQILSVLSGASISSAPTAPAPPVASGAEDADKRFVSQILRSTEVVWSDVFQAAGRTYEQPRLMLYRGRWETGCGLGAAAMGPFYCPRDHKVYLDLGFFDLMTRQLGAPGQFAHAYVVAHEVGHHVQNLLGVIDKVDAARSRASEAQSNALSVRLELQADCLAGVWATRSQQERGWRLEPGDVETALNAASQIGDDTLQRRAQGTVVPESFTHGTSAQRVGWFKRGLESATIEGCDTFAAGAP
jgi:predicted metalloprotease